MVEFTVPAPLPSSETPNTALEVWNVADTVLNASRVTVQVAPAPAHAPPQPMKVPPADGTAVSFTLLPDAKLALQVPGQAIPEGTEVTLPEPLTVRPSAKPPGLPKPAEMTGESLVIG